MSSIFKQILPIPESTVVGTGNYTIPDNKYAYLHGLIRLSTFAGNSSNTAGNLGGATGVGVADPSTHTDQKDAQHTAQLWLKAGDSISHTIQLNNLDGNVNWGNTSCWQTVPVIHFVRILINGSEFMSEQHVYHRTSSINNTASQGTYCNTRADGFSTVVVSLFAIPKNNLPEKLKEGN